MEMQFDKIPMAYLQKLTDGLRTQEQTLEVRLPDGMPDIGHVLGAWGQVIVRGKEWNTDNMGLSCGVMAWVLYTPEEGEGVCSVEGWLPFSLKWDLPETTRDGKVLTCCRLKSLDARSTSDRKLMLRATVEATGEGWLTGQTHIATVEELPEDVQLLTATYPVLLPKEAGEKAFLLEDSLNPPAGAKPEKLLYYMMQPEILDKKIMAGKVVFRGNGNLHVLCRGEDGRVFPLDFDLPFSQYADLEGEYSQEAAVSLRPCVTALDLTLDDTGALQLKAGILGQYLLCDREVVTVTEDAYSPCRPVALAYEQLQLPTVLDRFARSVSAEQALAADVRQMVDVTFSPALGQLRSADDGVRLTLSGQFQTLYYDENDSLAGAVSVWEENQDIPVGENVTADMEISTAGKPRTTPSVGSMHLGADIMAEVTVFSGQGLPMVSAMELGELQKPDPERPALILCRKGNDTLWNLAKKTGSTPGAILAANRLSGEPESDCVLLIPVK